MSRYFLLATVCKESLHKRGVLLLIRYKFCVIFCIKLQQISFICRSVELNMSEKNRSFSNSNLIRLTRNNKPNKSNFVFSFVDTSNLSTTVFPHQCSASIS